MQQMLRVRDSALRHWATALRGVSAVLPTLQAAAAAVAAAAPPKDDAARLVKGIGGPPTPAALLGQAEALRAIDAQLKAMSVTLPPPLPPQAPQQRRGAGDSGGSAGAGGGASDGGSGARQDGSGSLQGGAASGGDGGTGSGSGSEPVRGGSASGWPSRGTSAAPSTEPGPGTRSGSAGGCASGGSDQPPGDDGCSTLQSWVRVTLAPGPEALEAAARECMAKGPTAFADAVKRFVSDGAILLCQARAHPDCGHLERVAPRLDALVAEYLLLTATNPIAVHSALALRFDTLEAFAAPPAPAHWARALGDAGVSEEQVGGRGWVRGWVGVDWAMGVDGREAGGRLGLVGRPGGEALPRSRGQGLRGSCQVDDAAASSPLCLAQHRRSLAHSTHSHPNNRPNSVKLKPTNRSNHP